MYVHYKTTKRPVYLSKPALRCTPTAEEAANNCQCSLYVDSQILISDDVWIRRLSVFTAVNSLTRAYTEGCDLRSTDYFRFLIEVLFTLLDSRAGILLVGLSYYIWK